MEYYHKTNLNMDSRDRLDMDVETTKISMTITVHTEQWLSDTYPEAQSTQEAIRMAVSDARKHNNACDNMRVLSDD